ncbi:MAG TPA: flagellar hook-basal body complex protein FliE [Thermoanaerobacterales bacterium]|nr:flagellar hook-basal body complex protein FliE [Thermoanaerobacterales bacterium]
MPIENIGLMGSENLKSSIINRERKNEKSTFKDLLFKELGKVNSLQKDMEYLNEKLVLGESHNVHEVIIAAEKAELALQLTIQIRNKVLDAYNEIMRMQL